MMTRSHGLLILLWALVVVRPGFSQDMSVQQVELNVSGIQLDSVLNHLHDRYDLRFTYGDLDLSTPVSIRFSGSLEKLLTTLLAPLNIEFRQFSRNIVLRTMTLRGRPIKGRVVDADSGYPLVGATVLVINSDAPIGAVTGVDGYFSLPALPLGRYDLQVSYIGYVPGSVSQLPTSSGKETFVQVPLKEDAFSIHEILVSVDKDRGEPINEMAVGTGRSFSIEETQRFAAAIADPARMVQSYAGVSSGGDDLSNEIVIRGNSSRGLLWRLVGVEIPSPNHFGGLGNGGGAISMLSAKTLTTSDFYTGAFPAEFGNAFSGVFDLQMRNGNKDKYEYHLAVSNLGLDASAEGYLQRGSDASFLCNYRYSTLQLLDTYLISLQGGRPSYQDLSFKLDIPTASAGHFVLFGLGGKNNLWEPPLADTSRWVYLSDQTDYREDQQMGVLGLTHRWYFSDHAYLKTALAITGYAYQDVTDLLSRQDVSMGSIIDESEFLNYDGLLKVTYHHKLNARQTLRTGITYNRKAYQYFYKSLNMEDLWQNYLANRGATSLWQAFLSWKSSWTDHLVFHGGIHAGYLGLNHTVALDPRLGLDWHLHEKSKLSLASGLYSRTEHPSTYFIERVTGNGFRETPNLDLPWSRAFHLVLGYQQYLTHVLRLKVETYYQYLYQIPVSANPSSSFSVLNAADVFEIIFNNQSVGSPLVGSGKGRNFGIESTVERFFSNQYYVLGNVSFYRSQYETLRSMRFPTRYANNIIVNMLGGKEWSWGRKGQHVLAVNGRITYYRGSRQSPINLQASQEAGFTVLDADRVFDDRLPDYVRFDASLVMRFNKQSVTHSISLDVQNLGNRLNVRSRYYDPVVRDIAMEFQNGFIPFLTYTLDLSPGKPVSSQD